MHLPYNNLRCLFQSPPTGEKPKANKPTAYDLSVAASSLMLAAITSCTRRRIRRTGNSCTRAIGVHTRRMRSRDHACTGITSSPLQGKPMAHEQSVTSNLKKIVESRCCAKVHYSSVPGPVPYRRTLPVIFWSTEVPALKPRTVRQNTGAAHCSFLIQYSTVQLCYSSDEASYPT